MTEKRFKAVEYETNSDARQDPLGELLTRHAVTWAGVLIVSGGIAVVGLGVLAFAFIRNPWSPGFAVRPTVLSVTPRT